jgi:hypothetical protein
MRFSHTFSRFAIISAFFIFTFFILSSSLAYAADSSGLVGVTAISPWKLESLPCRALNYALELQNKDSAPHVYHLSMDNYAQYVKFDINDFELGIGKSKVVKLDIVLPCSVNGNQALNLNIKPSDANYHAKVQLYADIKSDYTREISVAPVSVCRGEVGKGSLQISNPSTTPNMFLLDSDSRAIALDANNAVLPPNSQAYFNFTVKPLSKLGLTTVGFVIKDFSGTEKIPFSVTVKNCDHEFVLLDKKIIAVSGVEDTFQIPVSGSGDFKLAIDGPEWISLNTESLSLSDEKKDGAITLKINAIEGVEPGDYDVLILAKNGETASEKIVVIVTGSDFVRYVRSYIYQIIVALLALAVVIFFFTSKGGKPKENKVTEVKETTTTAFDALDLDKLELKDNCKILTEVKVNVEKKSPFWRYLAIVVVLLGSIGTLVGYYFDALWNSLSGTWSYLAESFNGFFSNYSYELDVFLQYVQTYWQYVASLSLSLTSFIAKGVSIKCMISFSRCLILRLTRKYMR